MLKVNHKTCANTVRVMLFTSAKEFPRATEEKINESLRSMNPTTNILDIKVSDNLVCIIYEVNE